MGDTFDITLKTFLLLSGRSRFNSLLIGRELFVCLGPPVHPSERTYPCCIPTLGEFSTMASHRRSEPILGVEADCSHRYSWQVGSSYERLALEDSHSGRVRTLGKRV